MSASRPRCRRSWPALARLTSPMRARCPCSWSPCPSRKTDKGYVVVKTAEALARLAGVASALGDSSRYLWLKLPHCENYETVARATTLPILLLGGESAGDPSPFLRQLGSAMAAGPNVRGALVGRNVLYPGDEDPLAMADAAGGIIHEGWTRRHRPGIDGGKPWARPGSPVALDIERIEEKHGNASHDDGAGTGELSEVPVCGTGWRISTNSLPACWGSSATATSPASGRRCSRIPTFRTFPCATSSRACTWRPHSPRPATACAPSHAPLRLGPAPPT